MAICGLVADGPRRASRYGFQITGDRLSGVVDYEMYTKFRTQFDNASDKGIVVIELSTLGGDPEVARMMGEDVRFASETEPARRFVFLGKAAIYSAGVTFMSFFARENRYLTRGTRLMIHERKLSKKLVIDGPLTTCVAVVKATLNEIECSIAIQNEGFQNLVLGSSVTLDQVLERAPSNWYLKLKKQRTSDWLKRCCEARTHRFLAGLVRSVLGGKAGSQLMRAYFRPSGD